MASRRHLHQEHERPAEQRQSYQRFRGMAVSSSSYDTPSPEYTYRQTYSALDRSPSSSTLPRYDRVSRNFDTRSSHNTLRRYASPSPHLENRTCPARWSEASQRPTRSYQSRSSTPEYIRSLTGATHRSSPSNYSHPPADPMECYISPSTSVSYTPRLTNPRNTNRPKTSIPLSYPQSHHSPSPSHHPIPEPSTSNRKTDLMRAHGLLDEARRLLYEYRALDEQGDSSAIDETTSYADSDLRAKTFSDDALLASHSDSDSYPPRRRDTTASSETRSSYSSLSDHDDDADVQRRRRRYAQSESDSDDAEWQTDSERYLGSTISDSEGGDYEDGEEDEDEDGEAMGLGLESGSDGSDGQGWTSEGWSEDEEWDSSDGGGDGDVEYDSEA